MRSDLNQFLDKQEITVKSVTGSMRNNYYTQPLVGENSFGSVSLSTHVPELSNIMRDYNRWSDMEMPPVGINSNQNYIFTSPLGLERGIDIGRINQMIINPIIPGYSIPPINIDVQHIHIDPSPVYNPPPVYVPLVPNY